MTAEQIRNEILRIDARIEEAKEDIENAEKERDSLVEKLREKGFTLITQASSENQTVQKLSIGDTVMVLKYNKDYHKSDCINETARVIKVDNSDRPYYVVTKSGIEFWCLPEEVEKI